MRLVRVTPRLRGLSPRHTFECADCVVIFTELVTGQGPARERVSVLHEEIFVTLQ